jgi:hypothetical protein
MVELIASLLTIVEFCHKYPAINVRCIPDP